MFMRKNTILLTLCFLCCLFSLLFASATPKKTVNETPRQIDNKCKIIDRIIKDKNVGFKFLCYEISNGKKSGRWIKAKECAMNQGVYRQANIYCWEGKIVKINITSSSKSQDWSDYREYYIDDEGNILFEFIKLKTFNAYDFDKDKPLPKGAYAVEKINYFNSKGENIQTNVSAYLDSTKAKVLPKYIQQPKKVILNEIKALETSYFSEYQK